MPTHFYSLSSKVNLKTYKLKSHIAFCETKQSILITNSCALVILGHIVFLKILTLRLVVFAYFSFTKHRMHHSEKISLDAIKSHTGYSLLYFNYNCSLNTIFFKLFRLTSS